MSESAENMKYSVNENNADLIEDSDEQEHNLPVNLKSFALACIGRLIFNDDVSQPVSCEQNFLIQHYLQFNTVENLKNYLSEYLTKPESYDQDIIELARQLDFNMPELLSIVLALSVEEDPMVGRAIAFVQSPVGGSRPTLGLLESALQPVATAQQAQWIAGCIVSGMAVQAGVLNILNDNAPLPEQAVQVPSVLALALRNQHFIWPGTTPVASESMVKLPDSICETARQHAHSLINQVNSVLVIRSASLKEARSVASEVCRHLNVQPVFSNADPELIRGLGALCLINRRLPVFEYELTPSEQKSIPDLPGYAGAKLVIMGPDGNIVCSRGSILQWTISVPDREERVQLWKSYLDDDELASRLARDYVHSAGRIMELAQISKREARLNQRQKPNEEDVRQAAWAAEEGALGSLVQPLTARIPDEALVLPKNTRQELGYLIQRCKNRESLDDELGITLKARYQMGVKALLVGPSGTGKTLVASWLASKLGLPLYRVDIASVVSKYIGETEKNLATLLAKAEQAEIVLLFDEADSLFGKRTDIKDSNDRHANSQTNYLLQRIEFYKGIVLLTSNSRGRFDSAFTRRLDKVIEFSLPAPEERRALWQAHLGVQNNLSIKQFNQLAVGSELSGGHIRNVVLSAAVQAKANNRQIEFDDVVIGLESEYRKLGRQMPSEIRQYQVRKS